MRRLNLFAANLYPNWWRARYGAEFNALLQDARPDFYDTLDILKGAIAMQLTSSWTPLRLIALCGIAGLLIGFGTARLRTAPYESVGHVQLPYPNAMDKHALEFVAQTVLASPNQKHVPTYAYLMQLIDAYKLYPDLAGKLPPQDIAKRMREAIQYSWIQTGAGWKLDKLDVLRVRFSYDDPVKAQQVVEAIDNQLVRSSSVSTPKTEVPQWRGAVQVAHASLPPTRPFSDRWNATLAGLAAGTVLGAILAGLNGRQRGPQPPVAPSFEPQLA